MSISLRKTVIIIAGPTAVGKTTAAITLAKHFHTEIISADSRQCFKELKTGVARPSESELKEVKHHFLASHSIKDEMTAAGFEQFALQKAALLFKSHNKVIMVGGTGLYIKAFCEGLDEIPPTGTGIREKILKNYQENGMKWLLEEIKKKDAAFFEVGEIKNPQRIIRALEVMESTGISILKFRKGKKAERDFRIIKIGLELPREELYTRINERVNKMMESGLTDEVKGLQEFKQLSALQTVGYKEIFEYLHGNITLSQTIEKIKKNTRNYAKRQITWFKKDKEFAWFHPGEIENMIRFINLKG
ncbi:MAG TPA: tRNA (adenosine(37)-N6)-dimethylallyltransferase MiaA [Chitinophagaceae bacterium]|nr:tRNA (adenosine(37)-N6)-dimethylallyltransferase MiaA [Chitinophagaceae bacterium]